MKTPRKGHSHASPKGPSQRQLRAGELVRHALVEILREEDLDDPVLLEYLFSLWQPLLAAAQARVAKIDDELLGAMERWELLQR